MKNVIFGILMASLIILSVMPGVSVARLADTDKQVREQYQDSRSQYLAAKDAYKDTRQKWITARQQWQKFKKANETDELIDRAQDFLLKGSDVMIRQLEFVKDTINNHDGVDNKDAIIAEIDDLISKTNDLKEEVDGAETKKDITAVAKKVKNTWMAHRKYIKKFTGEVLNGKIISSISKVESFTNRLDSKVQDLKEKGYDTSDAETKIKDLNDKIAIAKQKHEAAKERFRKIDSASDADKLFKEGNAFVKEANQYLKESYKDIKGIVKGLREQIRTKNSLGEGQ